MSQKPSVGRIVHYRLSEQDAVAINRRRAADTRSAAWPVGAQAHVGNSVGAGEVVPLIVVRVWPDEYGPGVPGINGQAILDGNDALWVLSAKEGADLGTWAWPPRVE